ncbi:MAG: DnaJ domain-containing protein [Clostridium sp.]
MRDPYEILEIRKGASKDEIRAAYKKLAKQYHPDQYDNNPLRDLAEDKMSEINSAYDTLMKHASDNNTNGAGYTENNRYNSKTNTGYNQKQQQDYNNYSGSNYETVRQDINNNNLNGAQQKLNSIPTRDAEWNYLMGLIFLRKGWYDNAKTYITTAYNMNPNNVEYRNSFNQLTMQTNQYRNTYYNRNNRDTDMCDCCTKLWCADSICECMGGDLISCC